MTGFSVRPTRHDDIEAVAVFTRQSWARTYDPLIGAQNRAAISDAKHVPSLFAGEIGNPDAVSLVAMDDTGMLIGHAGGWLDGEGGCYVDRLHVAPDWHGKGVARALMDQFATACADRVDHLELTVLKGNDRAIGFYRNYGFEPVDDWREEDGLAGVSAQRLRRKLWDKTRLRV